MATVNWRKDYRDQLLFQCACGRVSVKINLNLSFNDKCCSSPSYSFLLPIHYLLQCFGSYGKLFSAPISNAIQLECVLCLCEFASAWQILEGRKQKLKVHLFPDSAPCCCLVLASVLCEANISLSCVVSRANRKHVVHGGERGHAGADGFDGHV